MNRRYSPLCKYLFLTAAGLLLSVVAAAGAYGQKADADAGNVLTFNLRRPVPPPETGYLELGGKSSTGQDLEVNSQYLVLDGKPWLPVMGEFHYARYPEKDWETEILKMKAAGVQIVSTYVFWIYHEEVEGQFDWSGRRDLRRFVELCAKHGMYVYLRIGPWDHGEVRNGGFPDWLLKKTTHLRENDPVYLHYVNLYFAQIGMQIHGLLWRDGGPIIGVQLENEYSVGGPLGGAAHIAELKRLAIANGIATPLYSVTGWPTHNFPPRQVIPMLGGYPDGFWSGSIRREAPNPVYLFNFRRTSGDMGAETAGSMNARSGLGHYPYFDAEAGGGMESSYHRRPLIDPDDIAALTVTGLGSGVNLYGYYMFQGGANPRGKLTTLQESQATGYPNDLPVRSYDYQAPLGEFGQVRESYRKVKMIHLFVNAFGSELAPMMPFPPDRLPSGPADTSVPRASVREKDGRGFLFVNNYVRKLAMPARKGFQAALELPTGEMKVPLQPITVPANSYFIWPFNLRMGGATLRYSTAQLVTRLDAGGETTWVFFAVPGIAPEFVFDKRDTQEVTAAKLAIREGDGAIRVDGAGAGMGAGRNATFQVKVKDGGTFRVLVLTESEAENLWRPKLNGQAHLALSPADLFWTGDRLDVRTEDREEAEVGLYPPAALAVAPGEQRTLAVRTGDLWTEYRLTIPEARIRYGWQKTRDAGPPPPVRFGPAFSWRKHPVATVPADSAFQKAAVWKLTFPKQDLAGLSQVYLRMDYAGDIGRAYLGKELIDDNFYNGLPWEIGLTRFVPEIFEQPLRIEILPLRRGTPIYLDSRAWEKIPPKGAIAAMERVQVLPQYETVLLAQPARQARAGHG